MLAVMRILSFLAFVGANKLYRETISLPPCDVSNRSP